MFRPLLEKFATPAAAAMVFVPNKAPEPVLIERVIVAVASTPSVTAFPYSSAIVTTGCTTKAEREGVLELGFVLKTTCEAGPATNVIEATDGITRMLSVVSVAEKVTAEVDETVDETVKIAYPYESVVLEAGVMESVAPRPELRATVLPATAVPFWSIN